MYWLEHGRLWLIGVTVLAALIATEQLGYQLGRLAWRRAGGRKGPDGSAYLLSAVLALLGLLLAFTFATATSRFDARRFLVRDEANAIYTTYLRIQTLDAGPRATLDALMVDYVGAREAFFDAREDDAKLKAAYDRTADLQSRIWAATVEAVRAQPGATANVPLLQSTNEMFDLAESRRTALEARVPITIVRSLLIYFAIAAATIGYGLSAGDRHLVASTALFAALALAFCLILDLDRPRAGTIITGQGPMNRVADFVRQAEAPRPSR